MSPILVQIFQVKGANMCGPADNEEHKAKREEFSEELSSALAETICEHSSILALSASSPILSGETESISVPTRPRFWQKNRNRGSKNRWFH